MLFIIFFCKFSLKILLNFVEVVEANIIPVLYRLYVGSFQKHLLQFKITF